MYRFKRSQASMKRFQFDDDYTLNYNEVLQDYENHYEVITAALNKIMRDERTSVASMAQPINIDKSLPKSQTL